MSEEWTLEKLVKFAIKQGAAVRDCEGCELERHCRAARFWCRPFRLLAWRLKIVDGVILLDAEGQASE